MPWNALLFPLVAGYILLSHSNFYKFESDKLDHQRLLFESAYCGIMLGIASYFIVLAFKLAFPAFYVSLKELAPMDTPMLGTSLLTLFLSFGIKTGINLFYSRDQGLKRAIKKRGNEMELLLSEAFNNRRLITVTLSTQKVYVGWVKELPIPANSKYIHIVPALSGYRDTDHSFRFTTHYLDVYADIIGDGEVTDIFDLKTDIVINTLSINHLSYFNQDLYRRFVEKTDK